MTLDGFVDKARVVGRGGLDRGNWALDLAYERRDPRAIASTLAREVAGDDFTGRLIHGDVKLAVVPVLRRFPQLADVNGKAAAVDEKMDGFPVSRPVKGDPP